MKDQAASRTALITSLMRAIYYRLDPELLIHDLWADRLVSPSARESLRSFVTSIDNDTLERLIEAGSNTRTI